MAVRVLDLPGISMQFSEEAMCRKQSRGLARFGRMSEGAFSVCDCLRRLACLTIILRPKRVPAGLPQHGAIPGQPAIVRLQPCVCGLRVSLVNGERCRQALHLDGEMVPR